MGEHRNKQPLVAVPGDGREPFRIIIEGPTCSTCPHWQRLAVDQGGCRIRPPTAVPMPVGQKGELGTFSFWPLTNPDQWCGEHPERKKQLELHGGEMPSGRLRPNE